MAPNSLPEKSLAFIAAPMVNQSDLPFRILTRRHGVTLAYTQMWLANKILDDSSYKDLALKDLKMAPDEPLARPVVVQLAGNEPLKMVEAARLFEPYCDAVDINLGCPQEHARQGHFGGYLLGRKDWPLVEEIVTSMASVLSVPVHVKIRLCNPPSDTPKLALRLAHAGASVIAIHARHVSANRRRAGPAQLDWVRQTVEFLQESGVDNSARVVSNGNVERIEDCSRNIAETGASGLMLGEAILANPTILERPPYPHPQDIALEYLSLCSAYPIASTYTIRHHLKSFFSSRPECQRTPYFKTFLAQLEVCERLEDFESLLQSPELLAAWPKTTDTTK